MLFRRGLLLYVLRRSNVFFALHAPIIRWGEADGGFLGLGVEVD
jgi:hypothetical protein